VSAHTERMRGEFERFWVRLGADYAKACLEHPVVPPALPTARIKALVEQAYFQGGLDAVSRAQTPLGETFRPTDPLNPHVGHLCEDLEEGRWRCVTCGEVRDAGRD